MDAAEERPSLDLLAMKKGGWIAAAPIAMTSPPGVFTPPRFCDECFGFGLADIGRKARPTRGAEKPMSGVKSDPRVELPGSGVDGLLVGRVVEEGHQSDE